MPGLVRPWNLLPIWVGKQNPCAQDERDHFSLDTATAEQQGYSEAASALSAWVALRNDTNVEIDADIEFDDGEVNTSACRAAQRFYVEGWDNYFRVTPVQQSGVYTSTLGGHIDDLASNVHPPNFIDGADWTGNPHTSVLTGVPGSHWDQQQRDKQYAGSHQETHGTVTFADVDDRCTNTWNYATISTVYQDTDCS